MSYLVIEAPRVQERLANASESLLSSYDALKADLEKDPHPRPRTRGRQQLREMGPDLYGAALAGSAFAYYQILDAPKIVVVLNIVWLLM
jgi:hypothetical protein